MGWLKRHLLVKMLIAAAITLVVAIVVVLMIPPVPYADLIHALSDRESEPVVTRLIAQYSAEELQEPYDLLWTDYHAYHGLNAVGIAAVNGNAAAVKEMVEKGVSPKPACDGCMAPAVRLVRTFAGPIDQLAGALDAMILEGVDLDGVDPLYGDTILHAALDRPPGPGSKLREEIVRLLLDLGASPDVPDADGVTARERAARLGLNYLFETPPADQVSRPAKGGNGD